MTRERPLTVMTSTDTASPDTDTDTTADDMTLLLARAFDAAWEPFLALEGDAADTDDNRRRLAAKIVQLAKSGEADEDALSKAGLIHLRVLTAAARLGARNRHGAAHDPAHRDAAPGLVPQSDDHGGHAFSPETVAAMSSALHLCLDALPFRIPSDAVQFLSASILDEASRGERDPHRLHVHALKALKARL